MYRCELACGWQVLRECFVERGGKSRVAGYVTRVCGGATRDQISHSDTASMQKPKYPTCFSLAEFSRHLFAGCFCRIASTVQRLVQKVFPAHPPLTTIAWSDTDDIATYMSTKQASKSWPTPLQDHYEKNGQGRRTGLNTRLKEAAFRTRLVNQTSKLRSP